MIWYVSSFIWLGTQKLNSSDNLKLNKSSFGLTWWEIFFFLLYQLCDKIFISRRNLCHDHEHSLNSDKITSYFNFTNMDFSFKIWSIVQGEQYNKSCFRPAYYQHIYRVFKVNGRWMVCGKLSLKWRHIYRAH